MFQYHELRKKNTQLKMSLQVVCFLISNYITPYGECAQIYLAYLKMH